MYQKKEKYKTYLFSHRSGCWVRTAKNGAVVSEEFVFYLILYFVPLLATSPAAAQLDRVVSVGDALLF